jgi:hypothetical protein
MTIAENVWAKAEGVTQKENLTPASRKIGTSYPKERSQTPIL